MKILCLVVLFAYLPAFGISQTPVPPPVTDSHTCSLSSAQLEQELTLSVDKFDQDMSGGWRALARNGCEVTAAMLIDAYITDAPSSMTVIDRDNLLFHAGQLYASAGAKDPAIHRFLQALKVQEKTTNQLSWNAYVLATVAFMQGDRKAFDYQRSVLAAAKPTEGNKINLGVIDGMGSCFTKPYRDAYTCRVP